ncbi:MAG: glycosyltransferase, partial [Paracoccaceae bacterium]
MNIQVGEHLTRPTSVVGAGENETQRVVVGIPSASRAHILTETVQKIADQTRLPDLVLVCVSDFADAGDVERLDLPFPVRVLISAKGAARQRNRILNALDAQDLLLFLDDDFLMAPDYLEQVEALFDTQSDVVLATGTLIADGIVGPGLDHAAGQKLLAQALKTPAG